MADERALAAVTRLTDEEVAALNAARSMTPLTLHMVVETMIRVRVAAARAAIPGDDAALDEVERRLRDLRPDLSTEAVPTGTPELAPAMQRATALNDALSIVREVRAALAADPADTGGSR